MDGQERVTKTEQQIKHKHGPIVNNDEHTFVITQLAICHGYEVFRPFSLVRRKKSLENKKLN